MRMSSKAIDSTLPENGSCTPRVLGQQPQHTLIGKVIALRQRLDDEKTDRAAAPEMHKLAAPIAATVLDAMGKDDATAEFLKQTKQEISDKRNGLRGMSLWELVALLAAEPAAFLAFSRLFCEVHGRELPQPKSPLTRAELAEMALTLMSTGPLLMLLIEEARRRRGSNADEVTTALSAAK
jgi:hypothetical protein